MGSYLCLQASPGAPAPAHADWLTSAELAADDQQEVTSASISTPRGATDLWAQTRTLRAPWARVATGSPRLPSDAPPPRTAPNTPTFTTQHCRLGRRELSRCMVQVRGSGLGSPKLPARLEKGTGSHNMYVLACLFSWFGAGVASSTWFMCLRVS